MVLRSLFFGALLTLPAAAADVALVDDELGQSLLITNRGLCYAVLPNHVSPVRDRISLAAPEPPTQGAAEIFWRDPTRDLALAYVEGALSDRCTIDLADLPRDLAPILQTSERGLIKSVHFGGAFFDRIGATIVDVDDTFVSVRVTDAGIDAGVLQGLSGAMLTIAGTPSGIAIDATSTGEARFLRIDRIAALVGVNLNRSDHPDVREIAQPNSGIGFRVTGFQGGDRAGVVALEGSGLGQPWVAEWSGMPIEFEITLSNDQLVPINRVSMATAVAEDVTPARRVEIEIDRGMPGSAYWTALAAPDMSPSGVFEGSTGGTLGRRLRIRIVDVWYPGRMLRVDTLQVE